MSTVSIDDRRREQDGAERLGSSSAEEPLGVLISRATNQMGQLLRDEIKLAQAEMSAKGRRFGVGGGLFGGAGVLALVALEALAAAAIAALALTMSVWAAALIVTAVLAVGAVVLALAGKSQVKKAVPLVPTQTLESVKADVAAIEESEHR